MRVRKLMIRIHYKSEIKVIIYNNIHKMSIRKSYTPKITFLHTQYAFSFE